MKKRYEILPKAISQNLNGIRKYAAGWFKLYVAIKANKENIEIGNKIFNKFLITFDSFDLKLDSQKIIGKIK